MKMFKILSKTAFLSFLMMAFVFVACKKDDPEPTPTVDNNEIVGKWKFSSVAPETAGTVIPALASIPTVAPCIADLVFTFTSDNKVTATGCDAAVAIMALSGYLTVGADTKWKVESGKLKLTNGTVTQELPITQKPTEMTITVNTNTDATKPAVNAVILLKKI